MSLIGATVFIAIATTVLAVGAIVTAILAYLAFRKQSREVRAIEQQVTDQEELTRQQAELLKVQSGQLDLQRQQFDDQRQVNATQAHVLGLQADELRESLAERKREAEQRHRTQAARVFIAQKADGANKPDRPTGTGLAPPTVTMTAYVRNASDLPIYDAELYWRRGSAGYGEPNPEPLGTLMPAIDITRERKFPADTNMAGSGAVLRFRDTAGITWMRRPDGGLTEQQ